MGRRRRRSTAKGRCRLCLSVQESSCCGLVCLRNVATARRPWLVHASPQLARSGGGGGRGSGGGSVLVAPQWPGFLSTDVRRRRPTSFASSFISPPPARHQPHLYITLHHLQVLRRPSTPSARSPPSGLAPHCAAAHEALRPHQLAHDADPLADCTPGSTGHATPGEGQLARACA